LFRATSCKIKPKNTTAEKPQLRSFLSSVEYFLIYKELISLEQCRVQEQKENTRFMKIEISETIKKTNLG
jgi:hypothetical protein